jgi:hypothetical protein
MNFNKFIIIIEIFFITIFMRKTIIFICAFIFLNISLSAQKDDLITVKAGTRILDYFPLSERYLYPEFTAGKVFFNTGTMNTTRLNYNFLTGEMEFLQSRDTLSFYRKKDIRIVIVARDSFFFDNGYLRQISSGAVKVYLKQYIKLKEVLKKDSYGTSSSGGASTSYGSLPANGRFYMLTANEDMVFQKVKEYYLSTPANGFVAFRKKTVMQLYPKHEDEIKTYLKSNDVDFDSEEDLIKLGGFLSGLKN